MVVIVRLDLRKYSTETILELYKQGILTKDEVMAELRQRGVSDYGIICLTRKAEGQ